MENFIIYLFYLSVILLLGILITALSEKFKVSNILFLVLVGYLLKISDLDFFNDEILLVLSALALILIVLEKALDFDIAHIIKNFLEVFKFSILYFAISMYTLTTIIFLLFEIPGSGFEALVLSILLSIIIYGVDPNIAMEFFRTRKSKVKEMLEIEGMVSGPLVVIFSFYIINYFIFSESFTEGIPTQLLVLGKQIFFSLGIGAILALLTFQLLKYFDIEKELSALFIITTAIVAYVTGVFLNANGSLAVVVFGFLLKGLTKKSGSKKQVSIFAHTLYIIVFILFGMQATFPGIILWIKGTALFMFYLLLRFGCIFLFIRSVNLKENVFMTLNVAKGIEIVIVMFIMHLSFSHLEGIELVFSLGFMFFVLSYITATIVNHFYEYFFNPAKSL